MDNRVFFAVLFAALLHAGWNSVIKFSMDRLSIILLLALVQASIAVPLLFVVKQPATEAWSWIATAAIMHTSYKIFLVRAYSFADLSQVYPLARGTAPLLVTLFSAFVLGVSISGLRFLAIFTISFGIILLVLKSDTHGRICGRTVFYAIGTAVFTAGYTLVDGYGARLAGTASGFILWLVIGDAMGMVCYGLLTRGPTLFTFLIPVWKTGLVAGTMSLGSYWIAIWAFTQAPLTQVAALRGVSIVFAILIAAFVLEENVGLLRWTSAIVITCGVVMIKM